MAIKPGECEFVRKVAKVDEELAEIYLAQNNKEQSKKYGQLAYDDLSKDPWMVKLYPERLERMKKLGDL